MTLLQESIVHGLPSAQLVVVLMQTPLTGLQANCSHASFAWHVTLGVYEHVLFEQVSLVHALLSLQVESSSVGVLGRVWQPLAEEQKATKHLSPPVVQLDDTSV